MQLTSLHFQCLLAAAKSREMVKREWLLEAMTVVSEYNINITVKDKLSLNSTIEVESALVQQNVVVGQVVCLNGTHLGMILKDENMLLTVAVLGKIGTPLFYRLDIIKFENTIAREYFGDCPFTSGQVGDTTFGRFIENCIVLQMPTDFKIFSYINEVWSGKKILKLATDSLTSKKITVDQYRKFLDYFFYLNHQSELCVPSMTEKSLMTNPKVPEFKKKFIEEHKGQMHDPFVIKELEDALIKLDKEYLGDDPSVTFFNGLGNKTYQIHRKKLFLTVGGIPSFNESSGQYDFIENSLMEGWTKEALPSIANEVRKGSYDRGRETAKGGAETKLVYRVFQDFGIVKDDCGTKRTIKADFKNMFRIKDFIGRTIKVGGTDVVLTPENISKYDGQVVDLYSPMTCAEPHNLCYKCCGQRAKQMDVKMIGLQVVKITSKFMLTSMKNMHGTVLKTTNVNLADVLL